ncbi:LacI family DNA-binding transcriptional regulator [Kiloniella laminariae]|uniref:LacI family DNA-binding transcriptional regulator n=1 Tax=Kiloniella laminariae TaxID=454162 RepID=A0ABT4LHR3_9PROT|nr:LacI family DNA-binding transcriptional regulator [Kiloniella laminariae]MCZ4280645.1 LacI family DNA-binding transcriptional regulator [Kiloniella laminariae]
MTVSIKDVACEAGVSVSTVSHVLNKTRYVAPETSDRVVAAVKLLGYQPSSLARALKTNKTKTLGMLVSNSTNPFFADVVRGVEEGCYTQGYSLILCNCDDKAERQLAYLNNLSMRRIDALVVMTTHGDPDFDRALDRKSELPMVVLDAKPAENICVVGDNSVLGGRLATEFLLGRGFRRIAILSGPEQHPRSQERRQGFEAAMLAAQCPVNPDWCLSGSLDAAGGYRAMSKLLERFGATGLPEAVFAFNDLMALGAIRALGERGLTVPTDISLIGYDDIDLAPYLTPALTTIRQPGFELGSRAAMVLISRLEQGTALPACLSLNPELVIRESVGQI